MSNGRSEYGGGSPPSPSPSSNSFCLPGLRGSADGRTCVGSGGTGGMGRGLGNVPMLVPVVAEGRLTTGDPTSANPISAVASVLRCLCELDANRMSCASRSSGGFSIDRRRRRGPLFVGNGSVAWDTSPDRRASSVAVNSPLPEGEGEGGAVTCIESESRTYPPSPSTVGDDAAVEIDPDGIWPT